MEKSSAPDLSFPPLPAYPDFEKFSESHPFCYFFGLPESGKSTLVYRLLNFKNANYLRLTPDGELDGRGLLKLIHEALKLTCKIEEFHILEALNQREDNLFLVIDPFSGRLDRKLNEYLQLFHQYLKKNHLWLISRRANPVIPAQFIYYFAQKRQRSFLDKESLSLWENNRDKLANGRDDNIWNQLYRERVSSLTTSEKALLDYHILKFLPQPVKELTSNSKIQKADTQSLLAQGFLLEWKGWVHIHPYFNEPEIHKIISKERGDSTKLPFHKIAHQCQQAEIQKAPHLFKFILSQRLKSGMNSSGNPATLENNLLLFLKISLFSNNPESALEEIQNLMARVQGENQHLIKLIEMILKFKSRSISPTINNFNQLRESATQIENPELSLYLDLFHIEILTHSGKFSRALKSLSRIHETLSLHRLEPLGLLLMGRCHRHQQNFHQAENHLKKAIKIARDNSQFDVVTQAHLEISLLKLKEGNLAASKRAIHNGHRFNNIPPGYGYSPFFDLIQSEYHRFKSETRASRSTQLSHALTCLASASEYPQFHNHQLLRGEYSLQKALLHLAQGTLADAKKHLVQCKKWAKSAKAPILYLRSRATQLLIEQNFPGQNYNKEIQQQKLEALLAFAQKRGSRESELDATLLIASFFEKNSYYSKALHYIDNFWEKARWFSFSQKKLELIQMGDRCQKLCASSSSAPPYSDILQTSFHNLPFSFPLLIKKPATPIRRVLVANNENYLPMDQIKSLLERYPDLITIHLKKGIIEKGEQMVNLSKRPKIILYLQFFCMTTKDRSSHREIFETVEGEDYYPDEDGNKLRQYIKRLRVVLNRFSMIGDECLRKTGEGAYAFNREPFIILFD